MSKIKLSRKVFDNKKKKNIKIPIIIEYNMLYTNCI